MSSLSGGYYYAPWSNGADGPLFAHGLLTTTFALPFCAVWGNLQLFRRQACNLTFDEPAALPKAVTLSGNTDV